MDAVIRWIYFIIDYFIFSLWLIAKIRKCHFRQIWLVSLLLLRLCCLHFNAWNQISSPLNFLLLPLSVHLCGNSRQNQLAGCPVWQLSKQAQSSSKCYIPPLTTLQNQHSINRTLGQNCWLASTSRPCSVINIHTARCLRRLSSIGLQQIQKWNDLVYKTDLQLSKYLKERQQFLFMMQESDHFFVPVTIKILIKKKFSFLVIITQFTHQFENVPTSAVFPTIIWLLS